MDSSSLLGARQLEDYPNDAAASTSWFQCPVMAYEALLAPYPLPPYPFPLHPFRACKFGVVPEDIAVPIEPGRLWKKEV